MIADHIRDAIAALLSVDGGATEAERSAVMAAASGHNRELTIVEVARRLGCQRPRVYRLLREGHLCKTSGGRVPETSLARYLAAARKEECGE